MESIAASRRCPIQVEAFAQPCQRPLASTRISPTLTDNLLKTSRQQGTEGNALLGGQKARLAEQSCVQRKRDFGFHDETAQCLLYEYNVHNAVQL